MYKRYIIILQHHFKHIKLCSFLQVIHDCRNDSVNLYNQFKIMLTNVFDTQVFNIFCPFLYNISK